MVMGPPATGGIDRTKLRLAVVFVLVVAAFMALFSRLWFLQVLASEQFVQDAQEIQIRTIESEPPRGRILDRNGKVLVDNRRSLAVAIDRTVLADEAELDGVLRELSELLDVKIRRLEENLDDATVSPYKPVPVAFDVPEQAAYEIEEYPERFPGVSIERLWVRKYPQGDTAAHILGWVNEISPEFLESSHFKNVKPEYKPGDIVGQAGVEYHYDKFLRGTPAIERVVVNSMNEVVDRYQVQEERPGKDLILGMDVGVQKVVERALKSGIHRARAQGYQAPAGGAVVMDPSDGRVIALASYPTFDPRIAVDGFSKKEFAKLGARTPNDPDDDALFNRPIQGQRLPASSFKIVTAGAGLWTDVIGPYDELSCPPVLRLPPGPEGNDFRNYSTAHFGYMGIPRSLAVSCDTFYYELGWRMETNFGPQRSAGGDGSEKFQDYIRLSGFGSETGIDLPNEAAGRVPDAKWCTTVRKETKGAVCPQGWLPGYTVLMSIGQGDLVVTPLQMTVATAAIAGDGKVWRPRLGLKAEQDDGNGKRSAVARFGSKAVNRLPLDPTELSMIQEGMKQVVSSGEGTARSAFFGFPLDSFPVAGKTGTSELGETDLQDSWFVSYGPTDEPRYAVGVYIERAGAGGESAAPLARDIWEGIMRVEENGAR